VSQINRLPSGGEIDRSAPIEFSFNGTTYTGFSGDTLASALIANDVRLVGRSFKYHRPRGIVTAGNHEPNALVQLVGDDDEPNVRATTLKLRPALEARSVNCWPSVNFDVGAINELLSPLFAAGFYYKTFMWPPGGWNFYAPIIRRMAGLGKAPTSVGEHRYERRFHHCDLLIVGAGVSGLVAARCASRAGVRVMLVDDGALPGGGARNLDATIDGLLVRDWVGDVLAELDANDNVLRLPSTSAVGYYDHNMLTLVEAEPDVSWLHERFWKVRATQVILATGAHERPLVFANNDRPGVMLVSAVRTYIEDYAVRPGRRAVLVTNNDSAYEAVAVLLDANVEIAAFIDTREHPSPELVEMLEALSVKHYCGHAVVDVKGRSCVTGVEIAPFADVGRHHPIACDLVGTSGGWNPAVHLQSQSGAKPVYSSTGACFVPGPCVQAEVSVGSCAGVFELEAALQSGFGAASRVLDQLGIAHESTDGQLKVENAPAYRIEARWELPRLNVKQKSFVDLQNDVTSNDIRLAESEGFESVEHVKRYTTAGMGTDQGKLGNANVIGVLSETRDKPPDQIGTTTYRPPYVPVSFGVIAGNDIGPLVLPSRRTSITGWIEDTGAVMFEAGANYRRPSYFPVSGETPGDAISREALKCRQSAGMYDGSPLGKFELCGPDVLTFLNRVYTNNWHDLPVGGGRFGWMLKEDGRLLDDGVTFRIDDDRYLMFVGTGAADHAYLHLERLLQLEWPELEVYLTVVTSQWTNICVCGPNARAVLESAGVGIPLDSTGLPFMGIRQAQLADCDILLARVGYTGELSYEVNVRAGHGLRVWQALYDAGQSHDLTLIGSEASMVMRCEKGFISAGFEGDGIVNPFDAGVGWALDMNKGDFIGRRSLLKDLNVAGERPKVVGLLPNDPNYLAPDGTPLTAGKLASGEVNVVGYVTQCVYSPSLNRSVAMAVLDDGLNKLGQSITMHAVDGQMTAEITRPGFVDVKGARMRG